MIFLYETFSLEVQKKNMIGTWCQDSKSTLLITNDEFVFF